MKKIISILLAGVLCAVSFTACAPYKQVLNIDGEPVLAGTYLLCQLDAYTQAAAKASDTKKDVLKQKIESKPAKEWIHSKTVELCRTYVYAERQFAALGLSVDAAKAAELDASVASDWKDKQTYYEKNGIGLDSYISYKYNQYKLQAVSKAMLAADTAAPTDEEAKAFLNENFARMQYTVLPKISLTDYSALPADTLTLISALAQKTVTQLAAEGADKNAILKSAVQQAYTAAGAESSQSIDWSDESSYISTQFISKTDTSIPSALIDALFAAKTGVYAMYELDYYYMIYCRIDTYASEEEYAALKPSLLTQMQNDRFDKASRAVYEAYSVEEVSGAVSHYSPKHIVTEAELSAASTAA